MIKPCGVQRRLVGKIISRFEEKGLYLVQSKVCIPTEAILREHYAEHVSKPFFKAMAEEMSSSQVMPIVWEGENAVEVCRKLIGSTKPSEAAVGSIRGDYGITLSKNIIHGADSVESAKREISIWFGNVENVKHFDEKFIYE
jgi:nucleoside-diphosphate kinase